MPQIRRDDRTARLCHLDPKPLRAGNKRRIHAGSMGRLLNADDTAVLSDGIHSVFFFSPPLLCHSFFRRIVYVQVDPALFNIRILSVFISMFKVRQYFEAQGTELDRQGYLSERSLYSRQRLYRRRKPPTKSCGTETCAWKCTELPGTTTDTRCAGITLYRSDSHPGTAGNADQCAPPCNNGRSRSK